ncbi:hypothetical protein C0Q70_15182 [Pomacea canaliculata]|uniref:Uncharacterized protein n=1 Tax=Pomacea canaliculata TaxID=400727 RepID=A0A2T7NU46_POMCA|nr:hypothetical protein C0Q70_15182 [Pomacea canaliculata]
MSSISNFLAIPVVHLLLFLLHVLAERLGTCRRARGEEPGEGGRPASGTTCLDLDEPGMESSSVQGELLEEDDCRDARREMRRVRFGREEEGVDLLNNGHNVGIF